MPTVKRASPTPSLVSDEITAMLHCEVKRLRKLQRKRDLRPGERHLLLTIAAAMREQEETRMGAVVDVLGYRFRHRDVPDEVLLPLVDTMTGRRGRGDS